MDKLVFATNNKHKLHEVTNILSEKINVIGLGELNFFENIPETADNLQDNALMKAQFINNRFGLDCFADDTGLEVDALGGAPGVFSARYAGEPANSQKNIEKLLEALKNTNNRKARFRTVIAMILHNKTYFFEGIVQGTITYIQLGKYGFGYDPVFIPDGYNKTFAQMTENEKNLISHRSKAVAKLADFLNNR